MTDILSSSGLVTHLLAQQAFYRPFAVTFPCPRSMGFHVLTQGEAYIRSPRLAQPIHLRRGDFVLLPRGFQHEIATDPATPASARERIDWQ
ncbi:MAG TPA: cupin domain-containing protein, partial [Telluria sp.]|nr:cupin domain-containing protein [Telluria sp.]